MHICLMLQMIISVCWQGTHLVGAIHFFLELVRHFPRQAVWDYFTNDIMFKESMVDTMVDTGENFLM